MSQIPESDPNNPVIPDEVFTLLGRDRVLDVRQGSTSMQTGKLTIASGLNGAQVVDLVLSKKVSHLVQTNSETFNVDVRVGAQLLKSPKTFFNSEFPPQCGPISKSLKLSFSQAQEKEVLIQKAEEFLRDQVSPSERESGMALVEELYMNAIYSAIREAQRRNFHKKEFSDGESAEISLAITPTHLIVSCCDPIGSLDIEKLLSRMQEVYREGAGEVINFDKAGGAGLGCVIMFEHTSNLILGVVAEKMTKVMGFISLGQSYKKRASQGKGLIVVS